MVHFVTQARRRSPKPLKIPMMTPIQSNLLHGERAERAWNRFAGCGKRRFVVIIAVARFVTEANLRLIPIIPAHTDAPDKICKVPQWFSEPLASGRQFDARPKLAGKIELQGWP